MTELVRSRESFVVFDQDTSGLTRVTDRKSLEQNPVRVAPGSVHRFDAVFHF